MATINCPTNVKPGKPVHVAGTVASCEAAVRSVIHNGNALAFAWLCSEGGFSITFVAPGCVDPPLMDVVTVVVDDASCDIAIAPCP